MVSADFSLTHYGSGIDSAYNRNEYQEYFLGVRLTSLPPSRHVIWEP